MCVCVRAASSTSRSHTQIYIPVNGTMSESSVKIFKNHTGTFNAATIDFDTTADKTLAQISSNVHFNLFNALFTSDDIQLCVHFPHDRFRVSNLSLYRYYFLFKNIEGC